ncbi:uncharacterized protein B0H64DRAFT_378039 [Chaetomium fimeti]|uniref:DUF1772-domain-containing protein n=1 Tax=Chaetomium fimeti TaxID=1854472 RepID=A0AAE0LN35_9PEZI|nr:hypothetical protein B0H64DRAFT_378039 [Chaetomium fimeti]
MAVKRHSTVSLPMPKIQIPATAVISGSFLSGAMISLSAFAVPVFLDTNRSADHTVRQWVRLYHYGHIYLPALCVATCGLYGYAAVTKRAGGKKEWTRYVLAAVSTFAMVPFTWLIMTPTNDTLFGLEASGSAQDLDHVRGLVVKWAWLHVTRSLFPLVGAFIGFKTLLHECTIE